MDENWLPVVGYEGIYEVSDFGRIRSLDRMDSIGRPRKGLTLRPKTFRGYLKVDLCSGAQKTCKVHRLVLEAFRGPCPEGMEACHGDGDPGNCRLDNLRWDTHRANKADEIGHGTTNRGERHGNSKLCATDIERIFDLRADGCTQRQISDWMHISRQHVSDILSGNRWSHLGLAA